MNNIYKTIKIWKLRTVLNVTQVGFFGQYQK